MTLSWTPIAYKSEGYYQICYSTTSGGPYTCDHSTPDRWTYGYQVTGLTPGQTYYFVVRSYTPSFPPFQKNELLSDPSAEVSATTPSS